MQEYSIYSDFDIKKHAETYINYLEVIILPDGKIVYAIPSHTEKLIAVSGLSREEIYNKMPIEADAMEWLTEFTSCVSVWNDFYIGKPNRAQKEALNALIDEGVKCQKT